MNDLDRERLKHAANTEVVRRLLISYFITKGFKESFDKAINPLIIQDMPQAVFGLDEKTEIKAHATSIDPTVGKATLGWNLFVLGNQRMFLGETVHSNLSELARQVRSGQLTTETSIDTRRCTTPRRIIAFVENVLGNTEGGYVDLTPRQHSPAQMPSSVRAAAMTNAMSGNMFSRNSYGVA